MSTLTLTPWITHAAAVGGGLWGNVTRRAHDVGPSRQALDQQAQKVQDAVAPAHDDTPPRAELQTQREALRQENPQRWDWREQTIDFPTARQQPFTVTAAAMGLSLAQIQVLWAIVLGARAAPRRATVGRIVQAAGEVAGRVLQRLDRTGRERILVGCLDEIFSGAGPVLLGVEPSSQVGFVGRLSPDRQGATW